MPLLRKSGDFKIMASAFSHYLFLISVSVLQLKGPSNYMHLFTMHILTLYKIIPSAYPAGGYALI